MTICCECGEDKPSHSQGLLGKMLAWKCQECTYDKYKKIQFKNKFNMNKAMRIMKNTDNMVICIDNETRELFDKCNVKYWVVD